MRIRRPRSHQSLTPTRIGKPPSILHDQSLSEPAHLQHLEVLVAHQTEHDPQKRLLPRESRNCDRQRDKPRDGSREERPARIDPDSPFAKLAALRDQLKK